MLIENVRITPLDPDRVEVSATCGGQLLYFRLPAARFHPQAVGDALLIAVLTAAMRAGTDVRLPDEYPISTVLEAQLAGIQNIWRTWNASLKPVRVDARRYLPDPGSGTGVGLFYAGGVDSSYSLLSHRDEVDTLVIVFGFDHVLTDVETTENLARNSAFAQHIGKALVPVQTNHSRFVFSQGVSRTFVYGATLASIALLLGFRRCYVASNHSAANMRPDGSHPVLDHRFSNGITQIIHDEVAVTRVQKTWAVAGDPYLLDNLRVCWEYPNENCGACPKCLRTMTALRLHGTRGPFPPLGDLRALRTMAANSEPDYVVDMVLAARAKGDAEVERELTRGLRRQDLKIAFLHLDQSLLRGRLRRLLARRGGAESELLKWNLRPDLDP